MMKNKILFRTLVFALVLGLTGGLCMWLWRPQTIVLADGSELTLLGVTYGKHHSFQTKDKWGRLIRGSPLDTTNNSLCVWIKQKHKPKSWPQYQMRVYDSANVSCAGNSAMAFGGGPSSSETDLAGILFEAFPRRGRKVYIRAQEWSPRTGMPESSKGEFIIRNPARGDRFPAWSSSLLPDTQSAGNLDVTLTRFERRVDLNEFVGVRTKSADLSQTAVLAVFHVEQNGSPTTNWQPFQIETMDATGNHTVNYVRDTQMENGDIVVNYQWGLWPDEPAWKLRVEMSRSSDFSSDEIWAPSGLSLTPGDMIDLWRNDKNVHPIAETMIDGHHVQLFPILQIAPDKANENSGMEAVFRIRVSPSPEGMQLTLLTVRDERNQLVEINNFGWSGGNYRFGLKKLGNTRTINITLALHRSRYVEFTVKPK